MTSDPYKSFVYRRNRALVLEAAGGQCYWPGCDRPATTADHKLPLRLGGTHDITNLRAACHHHNSSGGAEITNRIKAGRRVGRRSRGW